MRHQKYVYFSFLYNHSRPELNRMEHDGQFLCGFLIGPSRQLFIIWSQFVYLGY